MADKALNRKIHALGARCGLKEVGNPKDNLHNFVWQFTGKLSVSDLSDDEAHGVIKQLYHYLEAIKGTPEEPAAPVGAGEFITKQQISKVFGLIYELQGLDHEPSGASVKQRLAGIIKKVSGIDVNLRGDIFKGITFQQGEQIIEEIKRYVRSAKRKK